PPPPPPPPIPSSLPPLNRGLQCFNGDHVYLRKWRSIPGESHPLWRQVGRPPLIELRRAVASDNTPAMEQPIMTLIRLPDNYLLKPHFGSHEQNKSLLFDRLRGNERIRAMFHANGNDGDDSDWEDDMNIDVPHPPPLPS